MDTNHTTSSRALRLLAPVLLVALVGAMTGCSRGRGAEAPAVVPGTTAPAAATPGATSPAGATPAASRPAGSGFAAADTSAAQTALAKAVKDAESANGTAGKDLAAASSSAEGDPTQ